MGIQQDLQKVKLTIGIGDRIRILKRPDNYIG